MIGLSNAAATTTQRRPGGLNQKRGPETVALGGRIVFIKSGGPIEDHGDRLPALAMQAPPAGMRSRRIWLHRFLGLLGEVGRRARQQEDERVQAQRMVRRGQTASEEEEAELATESLTSLVPCLGSPEMRCLCPGRYALEVTPEKGGTPTSRARRLTRLLPAILPVEVARDMSWLESADLLGSFCHWLGVELHQAPWTPALRRMSRSELLRLSRKVGVAAPAGASKDRLVALILATAVQDRRMQERRVARTGESEILVCQC